MTEDRVAILSVSLAFLTLSFLCDHRVSAKFEKNGKPDSLNIAILVACPAEPLSKKLDRALHIRYNRPVMQNEQSLVKWNVLPRGDGARWSGMYVTINSVGKIAMSRTTHERFGSPAAVLIVYDPMRSLLALRPVPLAEQNAYPLRKYGTCRGRIIRAYRLVTEFGIQPAETIEFIHPKIDNDGQLVLDLRNIRVSRRAEGWKRRRK